MELEVRTISHLMRKERYYTVADVKACDNISQAPRKGNVE